MGKFFSQLESDGPNNKENKDLLSQYFSEFLTEPKGDSPLKNQEIGSAEEGKLLMETKGSLIPWLQQLPTVKSPSNQEDNTNKQMVDLAALNFIAPHFGG